MAGGGRAAALSEPLRGPGSFGGVAEGNRLAGKRRRRVEIGVNDGGWLDCERRPDEILLGFCLGLSWVSVAFAWVPLRVPARTGGLATKLSTI